MKVIFFGTSDVGIPILEALANNHEVIHVVTSPDSPVGRKQEITPTPIAELAEVLKIPVSKPEKVKNNPEFLDFLRTLGADIFIVVSYGKILPADLLDIPRLKTLNVHFSLLPKYRGAAPIQFALLNGETITGTTIFVLDELVDHGPILVKKEFAIYKDDTFATLAHELADVSAHELITLLPKYDSGEIVPQEQNHAEATFTKLITKDDGQIDWSRPAQEIYNMYRAYTPWPGIWTTYQGKKFKILECLLSEDKQNLGLITIQLEGKKPTSMADFLRGNKDFKQEDLGQ